MTRVGGPDNTPAEVAAAIAGYTPTVLSEQAWKVAATVVRAAVTEMRPSTKATAATHLSAVCRHLSVCGWDGASKPDLADLLTENRIAATPRSATASASTHSQRKSLLRTVARANGWMPQRQPVTNPHPRAVAPVLAENLDKPVPATVLVAAWEQQTGLRAATAEPLKPLVASLRATSDGAGPGRIVASDQDVPGSTVWSSATLLSLTEATDIQVTRMSSTPQQTATAQQRQLASDPSASNTTPLGKPAKAKPVKTDSRGKPMSRRAALAYAKAAKAAQDAAASQQGAGELAVPDPPAVTAEVESAVKTFTPHSPARTAWQQNTDLAHRLVLGYQPTSARNARNVCSQVAAFLTWFVTWPGRTSTGTVTGAELLAPGVVEAWMDATGRSDRSKQTMRSTMRRALASLNPAVKHREVSYKAVSAPYSPDEMATWRFLAANQRTPAGRANLGFIVGLCAGAGLDSGDLRLLTPNAFTVVSLPSEVTVTVSEGPRARTVPVRADYRPLVEGALASHAAAGKGADDLLVGQVRDRTTVASTPVRAAKTATDSRVVEVARLRNTWLVAQLSAAVPLRDVLAASGLTSARTVTDLLPYCAPADAAAVAAVLAGVGTSTWPRR